MSNTVYQRTAQSARGRSLLVAALMLAGAFGTVTSAAGQGVTPPRTPLAITPPGGNSAFLVGHAFGTQGYTCLPTSGGGASWIVNPARPEATLFTDFFGPPVQIITHFLSPDAKPNKNAPKLLAQGGNATWQSSLDGSRVWATAAGHIDAGSDAASCPNTGSIPCLLLQSIGNLQGPTDGKLLAEVTFIQRLNTKGGSAPTTACCVGQTHLMGYTADYYFYHSDK